ncbi:Uncharacterised protein [Actinobacillus equuli]|nr:Uncharacterised protein [Actinobacillus equuli]
MNSLLKGIVKLKRSFSQFGDLTFNADWAAEAKTADLGKIHLDMMDFDAKSFNELTLLSDKLENEAPEIQISYKQL